MSMKTIRDRFINDPEWYLVEQLIREYIDPLLDMSTVDTKQPAENVKAEIIGRTLAYERLNEFLEQSKILGHSKPKDVNSIFN